MLGWRALRGIASAPAAAAGGGGGASLQPTPAPAAAPQLAGLPEGGAPYAEIRGWAERCLADEEVGRGALEAQLLGFQRHFLGGMARTAAGGDGLRGPARLHATRVRLVGQAARGDHDGGGHPLDQRRL